MTNSVGLTLVRWMVIFCENKGGDWVICRIGIVGSAFGWWKDFGDRCEWDVWIAWWDVNVVLGLAYWYSGCLGWCVRQKATKRYVNQ